MEGGGAVTCDGRLFHRRAAATGNALSPTVDRRVRRKSKDVERLAASDASLRSP